MDFVPLRDLLAQAKNIAIISHKNPDGDTIGANLALRYYFQSIGKTVLSACVDKPKANYDWLPEIDKFVQKFPADNSGGQQKFDLVISVDVSSEGMLAFPNIKPHLNIDHHATNTNFALVNIVDGAASSTSLIIYRIFKHFNWKITREIATALLTGIYFDTGSFMHSNADSESFIAAGDLVRHRAEKSKIVAALFKTMTMPQIKLWGRILEKVKMTEKGVTVSVVTMDDLHECGATQEEVDRVIDFLNTNKEGRFCVLLVEGDKGLIKGSTRTRGEEIDLSNVCRLLGGGGHKKAAGFGIPGRIVEETVFKIRPN